MNYIDDEDINVTKLSDNHIKYLGDIYIKVRFGFKPVPTQATDNMIEHARTAVKTANTFVVGKFENPVAQERVLLNAAWNAMVSSAPEKTDEPYS